MTTPAAQGVPAFVRIATEWAERIDAGELHHGDPLPTRDELAEQYGVSKTVIRDALSILHQDGYIETATRRGTHVHRLPRYDLPMYVLEADDRGRDAFEDAVRHQGGQPYQQIRVETIAAPQEVADALGLNAGDLAVARLRLRTIDGLPYCLADSYFSHELVKGTEIASPENITRGGRHVLRERGMEMVKHLDRIRARRPHAREIAELGISHGMAVLQHRRISYAADDTPVRYMISSFPSDRWDISYEVEK